MTNLQSVHFADLRKLTGLGYPILRESGADLILFPFVDAAKEVAEMLEVEKGFNEVKR